MKRRDFVTAAAAASVVAGLGSSLPVRAQLRQDVKFLNGFPPGGTSDLLGRMLADALTPVVGQKVIVEQRTGASGFIAAEACAKSAPDGHTLFLAPMALMTISPQMPGMKTPIDPLKDLTPISNAGGIYNMLVAGQNAPFKTVPELIAYAKKNPGRLTGASAGNGTSQHLSLEYFKKLAGIYVLHVPYRGGAPAVLDMVGGRVDLMFGNMPEFLGQLKGGGLRPVGFGAAKPSPLFPNVPVISQWLPEFKITNWFGVVGPAGMSPELVTFWNKAINTAMRQPKFVQLMTDNGMEILAGTQDEFRATIATDNKRWGDLIRSVGISAE